MDMTTWIYLLSSAAIIASCTFLVRFFGGTIADQCPFSDDRKWDIDLFGVNFFVQTILVWSIIGYAIAYHFPIPLNDWWWQYVTLTCLSSVVFLLYCFNYALGEKYYNLKRKPSLKLLTHESFKSILSFTYRLDSFLPSAILTLTASYILTSFYLSGHIIWILIATIEAFTCAWYMALRESYHMLKKPTHATIHLSNGDKPVVGVLLKVNATNIRIRKGETILILNMDTVKWIEVDIEERP